MKKIYFLILLVGITFNSGYGQINSMSIVGEAAGGWPGSPGNPGPADVHQMTSTNGVEWTLASITLTNAIPGPDGGIKFRANNDWALNWGSIAFPSGTAVANGVNIPCNGGTFSVTFNTTTLAYVFTQIGGGFPTIAVVGSATLQGWPNDPQVDTEQLATNNGTTYRSEFVTLSVGAFKFRQNNNWSVNWGGTSFPSGPLAGNNENIEVTTPGKYRAVFNRTTGAYTFDFPTIAIVGEAVGGWPGEPGNPGPNDVHQMTTTDGETYTINNLVVTNAIPDGGAKFRQDNAWITSWGNQAFPVASSSNGANIITQAGTYNVTFTRSTGAFNFSEVLSTAQFKKSNTVVFPNPTTNSWYFSNTNSEIKTIRIFDIAGKTIETTTANIINASNYASGIYFAQVHTDNAIETIKLVKQ